MTAHLTIYGLTTMADGEAVINDPIRLDEDMVDALIVAGQLTAGSLNGKRVMPDRSAWPERWKALKTDLGELPCHHSLTS